MNKFLNNIDFDVISVNKKYSSIHKRIIIKILLKNHNNCNFSKVFFDIKFYDENNNLIDATKKIIFDVNAHSESIQEFRCLADFDNIKSYSVNIVDVSKKPLF